MSKLIEKYNKSPFANIGAKVSSIQSNQIRIPDENSQIKSENVPNILEVQKDFMDLVIRPYKTILEANTVFGDIKVMPTTSVLSLFNRLNIPSPVQLSSNTKLLSLNSIYDNIVPMQTTDLLNKNIISTDRMSTSTVLDSDIPSIIIKDGTNLLHSPIVDYVPFSITDILQKNSIFDDIVDFKTTSVLKFNSKFDDIINLPYSDVLGLNSRFGDIIINDITSVLSLYVASKLPDSVTGVFDFFSDKLNRIPPTTPMELTPNKEIIETVPMEKTPDKIAVDYIPMEQTPNKSIIDLIPMEETPEKNIATLRDMTNIPKEGRDPIPMNPTPEKKSVVLGEMQNVEKIGRDPIPMEDTPEKVAGDINPIADTLEKTIANLIPIENTPEKKSGNIIPMEDTPYKEQDDIIPMKDTPNKLKDLNTRDKLPRIPTTTNKIGDLRKIKSDNIIPMEKTPNKLKELHYHVGNDVGDKYEIDKLPHMNKSSVLKLDSKFDDNLYGFNFNDNSYGGVLNQYAVYFSRRKPLTEVSYKQIMDWAIKSLAHTPEGDALYNEGFHTPKIPVNQVQLIIPPYINPIDRLPGWANPYLNTLENMGTTLVAGYLNQRTIEILDTFTDVDLSSWKTSPIIFHQLAGEIYWKYNEFGNIVRGIREQVITVASNLVGETLARQFIPKVESTIGGITANAINSLIGGAVIDSDKVLMLYHILMGTKYTKSKAFHDRTVSKYATWYHGDTAVNYFDESSTYKDYVGPFQKSDGEFFSSNIVANVLNTINNKPITINQSVLLSRYQNISDANQDALIPINKQKSELIESNTYVRKSDSVTFSKINRFSSDDSPLMEIRSDSIYSNHPDANAASKQEATPSSNESDILSKTKSFVDSLNKISPRYQLPYNSIVANSATGFETYTEKLKKQVSGNSILLSEKGFPATSFGLDTKNSTGLLRIDTMEENGELKLKDYEDTDLIDFYFEDLSSTHDKSILIPFRAIITGIGDSVNANWSAQDYMGRADKFWIYQGFDRKVSLSFEVAINSKNEFEKSWEKINYLHGMCYPVEYPNNITLKAPIMALTIGNLFERIQVILNSMSINFDGTTIWDIDKKKGNQLPTYIKIALDFTVIFADIPIASGRHFGQNQSWIDPSPTSPIAESDEGLGKFNTTENGLTQLTNNAPGDISYNKFLNLNLNPVSSIGGNTGPLRF